MISTTVIGNITRDAELRTAGNTSVVSFSVASNDGFGDKKTTTFVRVSFFGQRAEKIVSYLSKGSRVAVRGSMTLREYNGRDGSAKSSLEMRADDIELLGGGQRTGGAAVGTRQVARAAAATMGVEYDDGYQSQDEIPF